jgi:ribonuclease HI
MSTTPLLQIHTDGASRGNPGKAAYAYVIESPDGEVVEEAGCLGTMTNNQAEYTALVRALEHALELGTHYRIIVHSDSELLVKQMSGEYRVKNEELRDFFERAQQLSKQFEGGVAVRHVRRGENRRADALCNEVLDGKRLASVRDVLPAQRAPAPKRRPAKSGLEEDALQLLETAAAAWKRGMLEPSVESVWRRLVQVLQRHHVSLAGRQAQDGRPTGKPT